MYNLDDYMTLIEEIDTIKKKIDLREWLLGELKNFESKYGMLTKNFVEKWQSKRIPEPEDHVLLEEFLEWEGLSESLQNADNELKEIDKRVRAN